MVCPGWWGVEPSVAFWALLLAWLGKEPGGGWVGVIRVGFWNLTDISLLLPGLFLSLSRLGVITEEVPYLNVTTLYHFVSCIMRTGSLQQGWFWTGFLIGSRYTPARCFFHASWPSDQTTETYQKGFTHGSYHFLMWLGFPGPTIKQSQEIPSAQNSGVWANQNG